MSRLTSDLRRGDFSDAWRVSVEIVRKSFRRLKRIVFPRSPFNEIVRERMRAGDVASVHRLGREQLDRKPDHETASYFTAWAARRLANYDEALALTGSAITAHPDSYMNLSLRGQILLELARFEEALPIFRKMALLRPEDPAVWRGLGVLQRKRPGLDLALPRILPVVLGEVAQAYADREWSRFDRFVEELATMDPLSAEYWKGMGELFRTRLKDPVSVFRALYERALGKRHGIAFKALCAYVESLLRKKDLDAVLGAYPEFRLRFFRPCPTGYVSGLCALLARERRFAECLAILDDVEAGIPERNARNHLHLRTYVYRWLSEHSFGPEPHSNPLSDALSVEMRRSHPEQSASMEVLRGAEECWRVIRETTGRIMLDLRHNETQESSLASEILSSLERRNPYCLVRLGDADSYGFAASTNSESEELLGRIERGWWGRTLEADRRKELVEGFRSVLREADAIGFPGPLRLARDLPVNVSPETTPLALQYRLLFSGVRDELLAGRIGRDVLWVDEYCNYPLAGPNRLRAFLEAAQSVVIVTCFDIPSGHILNQGKIRVVKIPPHSRVASRCSHDFGQAILPEVFDRVTERMDGLLGPGVLLMVSGGFAGKAFLARGKAAGAVCIDFGSAIDDLLGFKTRASELHAQSSQSGGSYEERSEDDA